MSKKILVTETALRDAYESGTLPSDEHMSPTDIDDAQRANERADHRVVGLVVETRPDTVTADALSHLRKLGCTKIQLGVQSVDDDILAQNGRRESSETIKRALELARIFGFKTHGGYF